jgi:hypothetical protein
MFKDESVKGLLNAYCEILGELRSRNLIRSTNNPVADLTESLVAIALQLKLVDGSTTGHDAIDTQGRRYEIKGRRITRHNKSRQLSFIRGMDKDHFDFLVGVVFAEDFSILKACLIPRALVLKLAKYVKHVNGWRLMLTDNVWNESDVQDITSVLQIVFSKL